MAETKTRRRRCSCGVMLRDNGECPHGCHMHKKPHKRIASSERGRAVVHEPWLGRDEAAAAQRRAGIKPHPRNPHYLLASAR